MSARKTLKEKIQYYRPPIVNSLLAGAVVSSLIPLLYEGEALIIVPFIMMGLIVLVEGIAYVAE